MDEQHDVAEDYKFKFGSASKRDIITKLNWWIGKCVHCKEILGYDWPHQGLYTSYFCDECKQALKTK